VGRMPALHDMLKTLYTFIILISCSVAQAQNTSPAGIPTHSSDHDPSHQHDLMHSAAPVDNNADNSAEIVLQDEFANRVNLAAMQRITVQHNQTLKTFDTYARDTLFVITGKTRFEGYSAAYAILDMSLRPELYANRNIIYIRNKPFREEFKQLKFLTESQQERIQKQGTVSLAFWLDERVQGAMQKLGSASMIKADAVRSINFQAGTLAEVLNYPNGSSTLGAIAIIPPTDAVSSNAKPWKTLPVVAQELMSTTQPGNGNYLSSINAAAGAMINISSQWRGRDSSGVEKAFDALSAAVISVNPSVYPSETKRGFELFYNRMFRLTLPGAILYFVGFVLFLLAWKTDLKWFYRTGLGFTLAGLLVHTLGIGIRWWLVQKSVGNWFESIPIKNQFESVLMSAFFGVIVALLLERWKRVGIFGAAAAFVGWLSLIAIFAAPYVTGIDIGGQIKQNAGILMTYWLYIHVTLVTASYALIGMTFVMGVWYVIQYFYNREAALLKTLDDCNLVMLQLAFWILGVGIITGALWADVSWGRPWGWDPKETFALITWIVYLIIIHVRFVTAGQKRGLITGVLSVVGFFVMLFNWIGVNFFLVGLHSYA
jgi:ABC-type transport system involved in cytochrome c biogenesis permease subunit